MKAEYVSIKFINWFLERRRSDLSRIQKLYGCCEQEYTPPTVKEYFAEVKVLEDLLELIDYVEKTHPDSDDIK